jgi:multidrug efflux system membrane fusion protein
VGQTLAWLDERTLRHELGRSQLELDSSTREHGRVEKLIQVGAVASASFDQSQDRLESARETHMLARIAMSNGQIVAPFDGDVFALSAEVGEAVAAGMPVIVLDRTSELVVRAGVPPEVATRLSVGAACRVSHGGTSIDGVIEEKGTVPDRGDGAVSILVTLRSRQALAAGDVVDLRMATNRTGMYLYVPSDAVFGRAGTTFVATLALVKGRTCVRLREVSAAAGTDRERIIHSGLDGDETFVLEGGEFLDDGECVRVFR